MSNPVTIKRIVELQHKIYGAQRLYEPSSIAWLEMNLTGPQIKSMFFINQNGSTNFRKLASALKVTPPNVTGIIDRLVEQGLVSRQENPEDRRMQILKTTPKGEKLIGELFEIKSGQLYDILGRLNEEELAAVEKSQKIMAKATDEWVKSVKPEDD